jgi:type II secretion system protein N
MQRFLIIFRPQRSCYQVFSDHIPACLLVAKLKKILIVLVVAITVIWGIWIAFPVTAMQSIIEDSVHNQKFTLTVEGLKKSMFYRLYADRIVVKSTEAEIISFHSVHANINPLRLIALHMDLSVYGRVGEGHFSGNARFSKTMITTRLDFMQANLRDMQFLEVAGIRGTGDVSGKFTLTDQKGHLEFLVNDAGIEPAVFAGVIVPLNFFNTIKGSVAIEGNTVDLASVSLDGRDIFARLKGFIKDNVMDLHMEVMPQKSFLENPLFLSQVDRYQVSPGYYVIPVKGYLVF